MVVLTVKDVQRYSLGKHRRPEFCVNKFAFLECTGERSEDGAFD